jgi:hypothetical protein
MNFNQWLSASFSFFSGEMTYGQYLQAIADLRCGQLVGYPALLVTLAVFFIASVYFVPRRH